MPSTDAQASDIDPGTRIILVTGANRGIGEAVAHRLAESGHRIIIGARNEISAKRVAEDIGPAASYLPVDILVEDSVKEAANMIETEFGVLDGLVNNAGVFQGHDPFAPNRAMFDQMMSTNVYGAWSVISATLPLLTRSRCASIVNVSSSTGSIAASVKRPLPPGIADRRAIYCCSKAALNMLSVQMAIAFRSNPELRHIRISTVSPGYTATRMNDFDAPGTVGDAAEVIVDALWRTSSRRTCRFLGPDGILQW